LFVDASEMPDLPKRQVADSISAERPLFEGADWDFGTILKVHDEIEKIARDEFGLDVNPTRTEIVSTEQTLNAYSSIGISSRSGRLKHNNQAVPGHSNEAEWQAFFKSNCNNEASASRVSANAPATSALDVPALAHKAFNHETTELTVDPVHLMYSLEQHPLLTGTEEENYIGPEKIGPISFSGLIPAHSTEAEWQFVKNPRNYEARAGPCYASAGARPFANVFTRAAA
jgi:hypothetical protein